MRSDVTGFDWLARVAGQMKPCYAETITFEAQGLQWFDANLCAPFGALLYQTTLHLNEIEFPDLPGRVLAIWSKNDFMRHPAASP